MKKTNVYRYVKKSKDGTEQKTTWYCSFTYVDIDGQKKKKTKRGFKRATDAEEWQNNFLKEIERQKEMSLNETEQTSRDCMTFAELVEHYRKDNKKTIREHTWHTKNAVIDKKLLPFFGEMKVAKITKKDILNWRNWLQNSQTKRGKDYSGNYLHTIHNQLSAIFNFGVKYYDLPQNPASGENVFKRKSPKKKMFWTQDEYFKFREAIMDKPRSFYAFEMLYWCGIRVGELLALTPDKFDFENKTVIINKSYQKINGKELLTDPKTTKSIRTVSMPDELCEEMKEYIAHIYKIEHDQRIFDFSKHFLHHEMERGCKATGVKKIPVHGLRHSHVSLLANMGWDVVSVAERMGHESIDITYEYAHMFPNTQKKIAEDLNKLIKGGGNDGQEH